MDVKGRKDFMREIEIMKKIDHPHIYKINEIMEDKKTFHLISEYLEGGELFEYLSNAKKINEKDAYTVIKILLNTLNYLHLNGITHRDLKPENIMLAKENDLSSLKLIDFAESTYNN